MQGGQQTSGDGKSAVTLRHQESGRTIGFSQPEFDALNEYLLKNKQAIMNGPQVLQSAYEKWGSIVPTPTGNA